MTESNWEVVRAYVKRSENPYALLSFMDSDQQVVQQPSVPTLEQKRTYLRKLENPYAFDSIFEQANGEEVREPQIAPSLRLEDRKPGKASKKDFDDGCRQVFRRYIPPEEGRILRPHYLDFITRHASDSPERRFRLLEQLRKYDLSTSGNFKPHFNREAEVFSQRKLREIEEAVGHDSEGA